MKKIIIFITTFVLIVCAPQDLIGQANRTLETKVADILAQLPTKDFDHSNKLMKEIIGLETDGILQFTNMLVPLGKGDDTKVRYALQSVAVYSGGINNKIEESIVEQAFLKAIQKASDNEIKTFLIERLIYCGTNASIPILNNYLKDKALYKPALATLSSIGTNEVAHAVLEASKTVDSKIKPGFIEVLGNLQYAPALDFLSNLGDSVSLEVKQKTLMALAEIASVNSMGLLVSAAEKANYKLDASNAIIALIKYGQRLKENGQIALSSEVGNVLLKNCTSENQLHFRSAAIQLLREIEGKNLIKTLLKEVKNDNVQYKAAVLDAASQNISSTEVASWAKAYKNYSIDTKPLIIRMLSKRNEEIVFKKCLLLAVKDNDVNVRIAGIKAMAYQSKDRALDILLKALKNSVIENEIQAIEETLLMVVKKEDAELLINAMKDSNNQGKQVIVRVLAERNATSQFNYLIGLIESSDDALKKTIYTALPFISTVDNLPALLSLLSSAKKDDDISNIQKTIIKVSNEDKDASSSAIFNAYESSSEKYKLIPLLSASGTDTALKLVTNQLKEGGEKEKRLALEALSNWQSNAAIYVLFSATLDNSAGLRDKAFQYYLEKVIDSKFPDDQKLLLIKKLLPNALAINEKVQIINAAAKVKTFLSLVFVSEFLNNKDLLTAASNAAIQIALPTPGVKNGLSGEVVRDIVIRSVDNLTGPDSQYVKIDVKEFLENMPNEKGFVSIFNGKDFTGWEGLLKNPISRQKMSKKELVKEQEIANEQMLKDWFVKDGTIGFKGEGYNNICTIKDYGDFEMIVDWKITNGGDSGIYLRGTPQVQIWDIARTNVGAQVGSGGLYNNQKNESKPLVVADNPIDEWNTFRIKMIGDRVTVYLNGVLVTDNVVLENYWDRNQAIFTKEAIELQAHGEDLGFKNIYVREIISGDASLSAEEKQQGFKSLFNGKDLDHWIGNKTDYVVENNEIAVRPKAGGHGNLYTADEYSDFIFRFEFKLTPGANNGLGIHAPLEGDVAYVGKELQILDDTAPIYANLKPYQYHGSVYGIIASKRGFLKPVGEWNYEEVIVKGDDVKITLNGTVIVEGNMKKASENGTADHEEHSGLNRNTGHIGFLGHGSELWFRNIRIKDLRN